MNMPRVLLTEKDVEVLRFLKNPRTRYEIAAKLGNHYATVVQYIKRLEREGLVKVVSSEEWRASGKRRLYTITGRGEALLKIYEEGESWKK